MARLKSTWFRRYFSIGVPQVPSYELSLSKQVLSGGRFPETKRVWRNTLYHPSGARSSRPARSCQPTGDGRWSWLSVTDDFMTKLRRYTAGSCVRFGGRKFLFNFCAVIKKIIQQRLQILLAIFNGQKKVQQRLTSEFITENSISWWNKWYWCCDTHDLLQNEILEVIISVLEASVSTTIDIILSMGWNSAFSISLFKSLNLRLLVERECFCDH